MINILNELNLTNGINDKIDTLEKHKDNLLLQRLLKMTYDKTAFSYGVTMLNINVVEKFGDTLTLEQALNVLEYSLSTRETTGNDAINLVNSTLSCLSLDNASIIEKVLNRDLRINLGTTNINKVFKCLIV